MMQTVRLTYASDCCFSVCFTVFPASAPEPPVISAVHTTSCTIIYQPPLYDGGAPVTGYILERRTPGPDSEWIRVNNTPATELRYTFDNLTPGTQYEFRVAAMNMKGMSDFSLTSPTIMTLVETPGKSGLPKVVYVSGTSVRLRWAAPSSNGGADITKYIVMFCTSATVEYIAVSLDTNTISYTIRNQLQAKTKYRFAVAAVNRVGQGPWSDWTEEVTTKAGTLNVAV